MRDQAHAMTLAEVLAVLAPALLEREGLRAAAEGVALSEVCIDSRRALPRCLFVALRGERSDGHAYVQSAYRAGAVAALVERPVEHAAILDTVRGSVPPSLSAPVAVVVPDALQALQHLARARRAAQAALRVIGVTGSVGKTTTKEAIALVLEQRFETLRSTGNYNNEIGLPLTLLALQPAHECVVLEMGMYALGEIAALCRIARPQVGVVTNVGPTHLERLGSIERIAQAKAELVEALPAEGVAILNGDDPLVRAMGAHTKARVVTFGLNDDNTVRAEAITSRGLDGVHFVARVTGDIREGMERAFALKLSTLGSHAVMAALAAVAVGLNEGLTWEEIQRGLLAQGRGLRLVPKRGPRGALLLDDSYNASPASALAALAALAEIPGRRLAVLGDMLELGSYEAEGHREVGRRCARVLDALVTMGQRARLIAEAALEAGMTPAAVHSVEDKTGALEILSALLHEGDTLLIKGSRGMAMETLVAALEEHTP